jgi:hypothetical protein
MLRSRERLYNESVIQIRYKIVPNTTSGDAIMNIMININEWCEHNDEICVS